MHLGFSLYLVERMLQHVPIQIMENIYHLLLTRRLMNYCWKRSSTFRVFVPWQVCRACGLLGYYNYKLKTGICSSCKNGDNISTMKLPYACKLLIQVWILPTQNYCTCSWNFIVPSLGFGSILYMVEVNLYLTVFSQFLYLPACRWRAIYCQELQSMNIVPRLRLADSWWDFLMV